MSQIFHQNTNCYWFREKKINILKSWYILQMYKFLRLALILLLFSGKKFLMFVFQWVIPIWTLSILVASGLIKLPFSTPFLDDLLMWPWQIKSRFQFTCSLWSNGTQFYIAHPAHSMVSIWDSRQQDHWSWTELLKKVGGPICLKIVQTLHYEFLYVVVLFTYSCGWVALHVDSDIFVESYVHLSWYLITSHAFPSMVLLVRNQLQHLVNTSSIIGNWQNVSVWHARKLCYEFAIKIMQ